MFQQWTPQNFNLLLVQELGHEQRLEKVVATHVEERQSRSAIVVGPELLVHVAAGNLPNPTFMSMALGLLTRSAQFVKCASGAAFLPRLFAHSIYDQDRKIGSCIEVASWRGGDVGPEEALFSEAHCVTVTGSNETLEMVRQRLPRRARFVGYGHRVSFGFVSREMLTVSSGSRVAVSAAADVAAWNQLGCLSPHVFYVQSGGSLMPDQFAGLLADELAKREAVEPRGPVPPDVSATIASRRAFYEIRAANSPDTRMWQSADSTAWTVIYETDPRFQLSCLNRFVYVKSVPDLKTALEQADSVRDSVSTVGLAASRGTYSDLAMMLARWGAARVCPLGEMQNPPLTWRHDGRPALGDLIRWTDVEG